MRRFKYLQKSFNEEMEKVLTYLKTFGDIPRAQECLAIFTALCIVDNLIPPSVLDKLFQEHLVKDDLSLTFITTVFSIWIKEKGMAAVGTGLRKAKLENKLLVSVMTQYYSPSYKSHLAIFQIIREEVV